MNLLEEIQSKIYELSKEERMRLREWFDEFEGDSWDLEFDENMKEKKLDAEGTKAKQGFSDGTFKEV
ncbi:MAG TPA: hypothetical protein DCQ28_03380 [Bacteroidetes bacterium]|nr:hypothetical protein [Bacteroidota bacterium]